MALKGEQFKSSGRILSKVIQQLQEKLLEFNPIVNMKLARLIFVSLFTQKTTPLWIFFI